MTGLTVPRRSCLLRAARERLEHLHEDYSAIDGKSATEDRKRELAVEITCLRAAVSWIWRQETDD